MTDTVEVTVGTLGKPHGLRGELTVRLATDEPERRFAPGAALRVNGRRVEVASARWHQGILLLGLVGVNDRTAAEALRGAEVVVDVPRDESPADEGEYWDRQLVGLRVKQADGTQVGRVREVLHLPAHDTLVVDVDGTERMVPFVTDIVPEVDLDAGHLVVADLPGLFEDLDDAR